MMSGIMAAIFFSRALIGFEYTNKRLEISAFAGFVRDAASNADALDDALAT